MFFKPVNTINVSEFRKENLDKEPLLIKNGISHWPALEKWTLEYFKKEGSHVHLDLHKGFSNDKLTDISTISLKDYVHDFWEKPFADEQENISVPLCPLFKKIPKLKKDVDFSLFSGRSIELKYAWLGIKGYRAYLHTDPLNNFLAQVKGKKQLLLLSGYLHPKEYINSKYDWGSNFSLVDLSCIEKKSFLRLNLLKIR